MNRSRTFGPWWLCCCLGAAGMSALAGCDPPPEAEGPTEAQPQPAVAAAVPAIPGVPELIPQRGADFASVPPGVRAMAVKAAPDGRGTVLLVAFEKDERLGRQVVMRPDDQELVFRDDGERGDEQAGDGIFSALTALDFQQVMEQRKRLLDVIAREKAEDAPGFTGRTLMTRKREPGIDEKALGGFFIPFPFPWLINSARSLMITDLGVVEDPGRTFNPCKGGTPNGHWTFGYLMKQMAGPVDPSDLVENWLRRWLVNQTINGFTVPARPNMNAVIAGWPKLASGKLDLDRSPMKLLAIVNRIDLAKNVGYAPSGEAEGRFVFQLMNPDCSADPSRPFLVILEYGVPINTCSGLRNWAKKWKALSFLTPGTAAYNNQLDALTDVFTKAGAAPGNPNGSALNQLRTNEFKLASPWELREFQLLPQKITLPWGPVITLPPQLLPATVVNTPDDVTYNGVLGGPREADLAKWINANRPAVVTDSHSVPITYPFAPFGPYRGGAAPNGFDFWNATGILGWGAHTPSDVRHHFSLNTCDACHGRETANFISSANFTHVRAVAGWGIATNLSGFLTGIDVVDPLVPATSRHFDDLLRRKKALNDFATAFCGPFFPLPITAAPPILPIDDPDPIIPFPPIDFTPTLGAH
jgi:hypothetical protein